MFKVNNLYRLNENQVEARVMIDLIHWNKMKKNGQLGALYGIDIGNAVYRQYGIKTYCPTVDDTKRGVNGVKIVYMTWNDSTWREAPIVKPLPDNVTRISDYTDRRAPTVTRDNVICYVIQVDFINKKRVA